jgi:hypothetical protein
MLRKIVFVLLLAALAMLVSRLALVIRTRVVTTAAETLAPVLAAPLMYAGIRG